MPIKRVETVNQHSWHQPELGLWWHALDPIGKSLFLAKDPLFGKVGIQMAGTPFEGKLIIRFRPGREELAPWLAGGTLLTVDPKLLALDEYRTQAPRPGETVPDDRYVLAHAVLRVGKIIP